MTQYKNKSFFRTRTVPQIKKLKLDEIENPKGLVKLIDSQINPETQGLKLFMNLKPPEFAKHPSGKRASRLTRKHDSYLKLPQPATQKEAISSRQIPLDARDILFEELKNTHEEEIFDQGIYWYPIMGR